MVIKLSARVGRIRPSPTLAVTARAAELRRQGKDVIGLGSGEPDFDTPDHIKQAAIKAIQSGFTKYTAVEGTPELKRAVVSKFQRENDLRYEAKQVLVSVGGKQSFYNLAQALLDPGDEVIIPAPYWVSYPDMVLLADGVPVIVYAGIEQGFKLTPSQLEEAITPRTRLFVINSPTNPTGVTYTATELKALGEVLLRHPHVLVATDDMYEHIRWESNQFVNILNVTPELYPRCIVLNGVSKAYAMTGWRIGYAAGPADLIAAMGNVQSQSTSNPASISQVAAQAALDGGLDCIVPMVKAFKERHDFIVSGLNAIRGMKCIKTTGAFYAFPAVHELMERLPGIRDDVHLSEYILEQVGVAAVPGSAFGAPGYLRFSFATSMDMLRQALERLNRL